LQVIEGLGALGDDINTVRLLGDMVQLSEVGYKGTVTPPEAFSVPGGYVDPKGIQFNDIAHTMFIALPAYSSTGQTLFKFIGQGAGVQWTIDDVSFHNLMLQPPQLRAGTWRGGTF
jgi:hypothetical protein